MNKLRDEINCAYCGEDSFVHKEETHCPKCGHQGCIGVERENVKVVWSDKEDDWIEIE